MLIIFFFVTIFSKESRVRLLRHEKSVADLCSNISFYVSAFSDTGDWPLSRKGCM